MQKNLLRFLGEAAQSSASFVVVVEAKPVVVTPRPVPIGGRAGAFAGPEGEAAAQKDPPGSQQTCQSRIREIKAGLQRIFPGAPVGWLRNGPQNGIFEVYIYLPHDGTVCSVHRSPLAKPEKWPDSVSLVPLVKQTCISAIARLTAAQHRMEALCSPSDPPTAEVDEASSNNAVCHDVGFSRVKAEPQEEGAQTEKKVQDGGNTDRGGGLGESESDYGKSDFEETEESQN